MPQDASKKENDLPSHLLDPLRNTALPTVLFCGAGFSVGLVPGAAKLYELEHRRVEEALGLIGAIDHSGFDEISEPAGKLYVWAEAVIEKLDANNEPLPKLRFAEALGLLSDPRWWGKTAIHFRGTAPRHRVVARFAKEGLWHSVWSFNWDCILEHAFDQIGLPKGKPPRFPSPWEKNHYVVHIHSVHFPRSRDPRALNIHKPHGCVQALLCAKDAKAQGNAKKADDLSYRLMVGKRELDDRSSLDKAKQEDDAFFVALKDGVAGTGNVVVGWSMGELSLRRELKQCIGHPNTHLAILDLEFGFSAGHQEISEAAGCQQESVHFKLKDDACPDRDDVFLWQQALFTLEQLEVTNANKPVLDANGSDWRAGAQCCAEGFFTDWADEFLPTWTRLCWSAGLLQAPAMPSHLIDLEHRDYYIPLNYPDVLRTDLNAAIALLGALPALGDGFDARNFPGGLFHQASATLVVPLPSGKELNDLRALRPLIDALRGQLGFVAKVAMWPIEFAQHVSSSEERKQLLQRLSAIMPVPAFADPNAHPSRICLIADIKEVTHAGH